MDFFLIQRQQTTIWQLQVRESIFRKDDLNTYIEYIYLNTYIEYIYLNTYIEYIYLNTYITYIFILYDFFTRSS